MPHRMLATSLRPLLGLIVACAVLPGGPRGLTAQAPTRLQAFVWVNTPTAVYHCPGNTNYGTTRDGEYMSEAAARGSGYRAANGTGCPRGSVKGPPLAPPTLGQVWVNTASGVYHCPKSKLYAKTDRGRFLPEPAARTAGYRSATGKACR